ncbi:MAG: hypothetical protein KJP11_10235, partial [Gammaproteobacteria bacterium]|nr:hypothetical protein [Gammaproteobacteria bacterium]
MSSIINLPLRSIALVFLLGATGCATIQTPQRDHLDSSNVRLSECARWFASLDGAVSRNDVTDIAARRMAGFPYLRIDRFLAAMKDSAQSDRQIHQAWMERMRTLDADGRRVEIANLPATVINDMAVGGRDEVALRAEDCAEILHAADSSNPVATAELYRRALVPDDYSKLKRALGLYVLTRLPFYAGVRAWQERASQTFAEARQDIPPAHPVLRYVPPDIPVYKRTEVSEILARASNHPLGLPQLTDRERDRLFATYAPVFEIETRGDADRIGRLFWSSATTPQVDVSRSVVYRRLGYTRAGNRTLLQLIYTAWMPERPREGSLDLLGGHLDGIVWRVTLAPDGEPVLFDSIHPCGCYHMFFPTPRLKQLPAPQRILEWSFTPATLPAIPETGRVNVIVQARTHYLRDVSLSEPAKGREYRFAEYDELRTLPLPGGGSRSIFGPDGLIEGTERLERFLFWPMGIASAGAMR